MATLLVTGYYRRVCGISQRFWECYNSIMNKLSIPRAEFVNIIAQCRPRTIDWSAPGGDDSDEGASGSHDREGNDCPVCADMFDAQITTHDAHSAAGGRHGRREFYGGYNLMLVWLYVEFMKARTGLPVSKICSLPRGELNWLKAAGRILNKQALADHIYNQAKGETLRRRYYQAVKMLRAEAASLRGMHGKSSVLGAVSQTEK